MKSLLIYLLQLIIASGILYSYYHFFLKNKKFHRYNRFYLLAAFVISIIIPFLNIPVYFTSHETESSFILQTLTSISSSTTEEAVLPVIYSSEPQNHWFTWQNLICILYISIAVIVLIRILFSLRKIRSIIRNNPVEKLENINFVNTNEPGTPFSFFRWLFWNRKIELQSEKGEQIFRHELFHIQQGHSRDIIFIEFLMIIFWMNPFFYLMKKEIKAIHEFLADKFATNEHNKWDYAELLLMQALGSKQHLVNPFFHNQIKRRIAMITLSQKPGHQYLRKLAVLPIAAIVVGLFAFSYKNINEKSRLLAIDKPINVVIDAGHGIDATGKYNGVKTADGSYEDDIVLAIAKKIKELNTNDKLHIILTREGKNLVELPKRVEFANSQNPDLFISLHTNIASMQEKDKSGMDIYVSAKNTTHYAENKILATILFNYFSQIHPVNKIKQREAGVYVIDNSNCPSALVELGYVSNREDLAFMKSANGQEKIANSILQSIEQYILQSEADDWGERKRIVSDTTKPEIKLVIDPITGEKNLMIDGKKVTGIILGKETNQYGLITEEGSMRVISKEQSKEIKSKYGDVIKGLLLKNETAKKDEPDNKIFDKVEIEPSFPGGNTEWKKFVERNLNAGVPVKNNAPVGNYTVIVQFIVKRDGSISNIKTLTKHGYGMEDEAIRIIAKGPRWIPAKQNGHDVNAYRKQPITFIVQNNKIVVSTGNTKMNVLYMGIDNLISVAASGSSDEKITVSVEGGGGTFSKAADGLYNVHVSSITDDCSLNVYVDGKLASTSHFRVRSLPQPMAIIGGYSSGSKVSPSMLKTQEGVGIYIKDFPMDIKYTLTGFTFTVDNDSGGINTADCQGSLFSSEAKQLIAQFVKPGKTVTIDKILAKDPGGRELKIPSLVYFIN